MTQHRGSFTDTTVAREGELPERFRRISRYGIELQWTIFSRSQSTGGHPKSTIYDRSMPFDTWNLSETQGNVFGNPRLMFDSTQMLFQGILHSTNPSVTGSIKCSRERSITNWEHNTNADVCKKAVNPEFFLTSGSSTEFSGCAAKTTDIGASVR